MSLKNWLFFPVIALCATVAAPLAALDDVVARRIVVIGEGRVSAPPDKAVITLGARHSAKTAADALAQTNEAVAAILSRMAELGIDGRDMQTSSLNLNPIWGKSSRYEDGEVVPPIGFEASNSISVTLRDLDQLGGVLDQVTQEGANAFSGFRFGLIDPVPVQDEARKVAIIDARRKAELFAAAAGVTLGQVVLITEDLNGGGGFQPPMMEMSAVRSSSVPIAQGEVSQQVSLKIVFSIAE